MPRTKNQVLILCATSEIKALLRLAAERERRSVASMVEVLVLNHAKQHGFRYRDASRNLPQVLT